MTKTLLIICALVLGLVAIELLFVPIHADICDKNQYTGQKECSSYNIGLVLVWHVGETLNYYGPIITALATGFIALFTFTLKQSTDKLWDAGERQLKASRQTAAIQAWQTRHAIGNARRSADAADAAAKIATQTLLAGQRAWVRITVEPSVDEPITVNQTGITIGVSIAVENIGNAPALKISTHVWLVPLSSTFIWPQREQRRLCDELRSEAFSRFSFSLFPNENTVEASRKVDISKEEIDCSPAGSSQSGIAALYLVGCVDYTFPIDELNHHQTGFIYRIIRAGGDEIRPQDGGVAAGLWALAADVIVQGRHID